MTPAFDQRSVGAYTAVMTGAAEELMAKWDSVGSDTTVDVSIAMTEVTLQIISRTMFSSDSDDMAAIMERSFGEYQAQMRPNILDFIGMPAWLAGLGRMNVAKRTLREFNGVIDRLIAARTRNPESSPKDLLGRLIAARDEQTGTRMTAQEVRDNIITIFMAGHETTAMTMTWTWYLLSQHPAVEAKLHAELDAVLKGRAPTYEDLPRLPYSRMIIDESMRLYPPATTMLRVALRKIPYAGARFPRDRPSSSHPGCCIGTPSNGRIPADLYLSDLIRKTRRIGRGSRICHLAAAGELALAQHSRWPKLPFCLQQLPVDIDSRCHPGSASSPGR